jgi:hypothetical protein
MIREGIFQTVKIGRRTYILHTEAEHALLEFGATPKQIDSQTAQPDIPVPKSKGDNPWLKDHWDVKRQQAITKFNPDLAKLLANSAEGD